MKVILSIKPYYADKILKGEKLYELRKNIFKSKDINKVVIYASAPISKIIGEFEIARIHHRHIGDLWELTKLSSGVDKSFFDNYFNKREMGFAIQIKNVLKYNQSYDIKERYGVSAPQSFTYINEN